MKKYKVRFEFFGKKMLTEVEAENIRDARNIVCDRLHFLSVEEVRQAKREPDHIIDFLAGFGRTNRQN